MIVTRCKARGDTPYFDLPGDHTTWDENALILASNYRISLDEAHRRLARAFPQIYEERAP
jgi:hypothetical protein